MRHHIIESSASVGRTLLGGRSTVGHHALDAVIGVRIPASQPAFARLRRASARSAASRPRTQASSPTREGCLAEAARSERRRTSVSAYPPRLQCCRIRYLPQLRAVPTGFSAKSPWHLQCLAFQHARYRSTIRLHPPKRKRSGSPLRRSDYRRRRTTCLAQRRAVRLHQESPAVVAAWCLSSSR